MTPNVLTVEELAGELRIGRKQAYALIKSGQIYSARIGRAIRVPRAAVDRFLNEDAQRPPLAVVKAAKSA